MILSMARTATKRIMNINAQDAQDNRDGTLLHGKLIPAKIRCGNADAQE